MELKGKYAVISVNEALSKFLNEANLTLYSGSIKLNFDRFVNLNERGHILANTLLRIIYLYVHINNLFSNDFSIEMFTDDLLNECFNGKISAKNYYRDNMRVITMDQAVNLKLIPKEINTFETIKIHNENFDQSNLLPKNLNTLFNLNSYPLKIKLEDDNTMATYIPKDEVKQLIIQKYLVHEIFLTLRNTPTFRKRLENFNRLRAGLPILKIDEIQSVNLIEFIKISIELDTISVIHELRKDESINLLYAIIKSDYDLVCDCLKVIDPRWYNNEYYFVALQMKNEKIIDLIRNTIIINTWLGKQVFMIGFEDLLGTTSSYLDITKYMKNNLYV
jgi:hypothetical protein